MPVFGLKEREKVAVFIDGPNTHQSAKANDTDIDFKKLVSIFKHECDLRHMFYYTPVQEGHGQDDMSATASKFGGSRQKSSSMK